MSKLVFPCGAEQALDYDFIRIGIKGRKCVCCKQRPITAEIETTEDCTEFLKSLRMVLHPYYGKIYLNGKEYLRHE